ncbi:MAG: type II toxin-antitoxin system prevent-host-death family antitoxin [Acidimicrobiales bacterium]|jgi:prevent-host-death family protein|nr:type II toxin-antitoxin system prevent-host-death family antitoxin [Acidimicrobiales bacterium]
MPLSTTVQHVGTRDLRTNLAHYLRAASAGHTIFVTLDGQPVAQLCPIREQADATSVEALISSGLVEAPNNSDRDMLVAPFELPGGLSSDRALREIRGR